MGLLDILPDRPLTPDEFRALERNESIDALSTDESPGPITVLSVEIGEKQLHYHYTQGRGWHGHHHDHEH